MPGQRDEKGAILLVAALSLMVLLLFAGLAINSGMLQLQRLQLQTAADAAAIGAAHELASGNAGGMEAAAQTDAALNGYGDGKPGENRVVVHYPPRQGRYAGDPKAVEVIATHTGPGLILALSGHQPPTVTARAVSRTTGGGAVVLGE